LNALSVALPGGVEFDSQLLKISFKDPKTYEGVDFYTLLLYGNTDHLDGTKVNATLQIRLYMKQEEVKTQVNNSEDSAGKVLVVPLDQEKDAQTKTKAKREAPNENWLGDMTEKQREKSFKRDNRLYLEDDSNK